MDLKAKQSFSATQNGRRLDVILAGETAEKESFN